MLSTIMMPPGIPVAAVTIDGAKNAALLAAEILAVSDETIAGKLAKAREADREKTLAADREVREMFS
jgi:5-(carboxyamino)imidazole ribonucleotide mutase